MPNCDFLLPAECEYVLTQLRNSDNIVIVTHIILVSVKSIYRHAAGARLLLTRYGTENIAFLCQHDAQSQGAK